MHTLETDTVAPQTLHSLLEEVLALGRHARDVVLLPLNGSVDVLEDLLHGVRDLVTDTISGDEGHLVNTKFRSVRSPRCQQTYSVDTTILGGELRKRSSVTPDIGA